MNRLGQRIKNLEGKLAGAAAGWSWMNDFDKVDRHAKQKLSSADRALFPQVWEMRTDRRDSAFTDEQRAAWARYEQAYAESVGELQLESFMSLDDLLL